MTPVTSTVDAFTAEVIIGLLFFSVPAFAQESKTKIRISYPNISICRLGLFAAQQWKIFEQNGLDIRQTISKLEIRNSKQIQMIKTQKSSNPPHCLNSKALGTQACAIRK